MRTNRLFLFILLCVTMAGSVRADKLGDLPELTLPLDLGVEGNRLFVSQRTDVLIYSLPELELVIRFGREGEGPGEFKIPHMGKGLSMLSTPDYLIVNSDAKVSFFSHNGRLRREVKVPPMVTPLPAGQNFVSNTTVTDEGKRLPCMAVGLFDRHFNKVRDLFTSGIEFGMGAKLFMPPHEFHYTVSGNGIFVSSGSEHVDIGIFNEKGDRIGGIRKEVEPLPVTPEYRDAVVHYYKTDPVFKDFWEYTKQYLVIRDHFPAVRALLVDGGRVYLQSYRASARGILWWIFDLDGTPAGTEILPTGQTSPLDIPPFTIHDGKYYYLKENPDSEEWELHRKDVR